MLTWACVGLPVAGGLCGWLGSVRSIAVFVVAGAGAEVEGRSYFSSTSESGMLSR